MKNLKYVMKIFNGTGVKKQGRNWHILVAGGEKIRTFGQNIYPYSRGALNRSISVYQEFSLELLE